MLTFISSFILYLVYSRLIYSKAKTGGPEVHCMFSAINAIFWGFPSYNLPYWVLLPLVLNSTRLELWFDSIMIHSNNVAFAVLKCIKNFIPMSVMFYFASTLKANASFVLSILTIDIIYTILWAIKLNEAYFRYSDPSADQSTKKNKKRKI